LPSLAAVADGRVVDILTWPLILGLVLLGCFPLVIKLCWKGREIESRVDVVAGDGG
jgi:hypothetical protein